MHINISLYSFAKQTVLSAIVLKEVETLDPLIAVKAAHRHLFNMHSQALSHIVGSVLTNK